MLQATPGISSSIAEARSLPAGTAVELRGQLRSIAPVVGPFSRERLVGYRVALSLRGRGFASRRDLMAWRDAVLSDGTGVIRVLLGSGPVRAPVLAGAELHDEEARHALDRLEVEKREGEGTVETLEFLERAVLDGARVSVFGTLRVAAAEGSAFRSSAAPEVRLVATDARPIVLLPRGA
ncbi:MAG: hypothetical protein ACFCGT_00500 [Sandaracinaceae bacterium]